MTSSKTTKRALFSSALAMVVCVAMLIGTTFAWFTDTASTSVNKIQAGTLDVALEMWDATQNDWVSAEGKTLDFVKAQGHENEEILWEPGCIYKLPELRVVNKGNLALKYAIQITGIQGDAKLNEAIEWTMTGIGNGELLKNTTSGNITITGRMREDAGNEYQGLSIDGISITVYATQLAHEYDSSGNQYDAAAPLPWDGKTTTAPTQTEGVYHINTAEEFAAYITDLNCGAVSTYSSAKVVLDKDIDLGGYTLEVSGDGYYFNGEFDGNGHTVSNYTIKRTDTGIYTGLFCIYLSEGGTVKNLTVKNATVIGKEQVSAIATVENGGTIENCHVYDATLIGEKKVGVVSGYNNEGTVKDCTATDCTVYASDARSNQVSVFGYDNNGTFTDNEYERVTLEYGSTVTWLANGVLEKNGVYEISNAKGLVYCATTFNTNNATVDKTFKLVNDIDMFGVNWTPWCNEQQYFGGTFDGQGHTIKNLTINDTTTADGHVTGFIGRLGANVLGAKAIQNVTFDKAVVKGYHYVGVAVGYNEFGTVNNVKVTNSQVTATCAATTENVDPCGDKAGAVIGFCAPNTLVVVKNCSASNCTVTAARDAAKLIGFGYTNNTYDNLSAENVTVNAVKGDCTHSRGGQVSANALVGNGTTAGLTLD